jgi:hypothetical protein
LYQFNGKNIPYNTWLKKIKTGVFEAKDLKLDDDMRRMPKI